MFQIYKKHLKTEFLVDAVAFCSLFVAWSKGSFYERIPTRYTPQLPPISWLPQSINIHHKIRVSLAMPSYIINVYKTTSPGPRGGSSCSDIPDKTFRFFSSALAQPVWRMMHWDSGERTVLHLHNWGSAMVARAAFQRKRQESLARFATNEANFELSCSCCSVQIFRLEWCLITTHHKNHTDWNRKTHLTHVF